MGNGLPISAVTGKSEFMKEFDKLWVSSTNNSEALSMAGTIAVINEMQNKHTISHCWEIGKKLFDGWNKIVENHGIDAKMIGYPIRMTLKCFDSKNEESIILKSIKNEVRQNYTFKEDLEILKILEKIEKSSDTGVSQNI